MLVEIYSHFCGAREELEQQGNQTQSILKEINSEYSLKGLMLKLSSSTLLPDVKSQLTGKDPDAGKD